MRVLEHDTARLAVRLVAAVPGGYALTAATVAVLGGLLRALGMQRSESVVLAAMLGFVFYLAYLLWAFAERRLARLCAAVFGGVAACTAVLWVLRPGA